MESANSSSIHSSSEAEDEYDNRCAADVTNISTIPPAPPSHTSFFDPMAPLQTPTWASLRPFHLSNQQQEHPPCTHLSLPQPLPPPPPPPPPSSSNAPAPSRGSRKRARASRRAPTTVLTTDTSNFRQMVQEFTGIPSPPFPTFARPRLDLLHAAAASPSIRLGFFDPSTLLRPFVHKQAAPSPPPPLSGNSPSFFPSFPTTAASSSSPITAIDGCQLLPMQQQQQQQRRSTPVFTFQSLLEEVTGPQEAGNLTGSVPTTTLVASASSSSYVEQKGPENNPSTSQGIVDSSWICSLDR